MITTIFIIYKHNIHYYIYLYKIEYHTITQKTIAIFLLLKNIINKLKLNKTSFYLTLYIYTIDIKNILSYKKTKDYFS